MQSFRWDEHSALLTHSVSELYRHSELTDCILDVEGALIHVHKVVISACSPYFKTLLKNNKAITLISIKDVSYKVMKLILDFIYYGETEVHVTDVYSLIKTAELFEMTSLKHNVCHCFQMELLCKDISARSMDDKFSVSCSNLIRHDTNNLMEEQVPQGPSVLNTREERLGFKSENIHVHATGKSPAENLNNFPGVSGQLNEDQSKGSIPNTCGSFKENTNREKENVNEELLPLAFVAVSEIKEPNEVDQDNVTCFDSVLKDPLGEYYGTTLDETEGGSVKKEFTFQSELQVKKEIKKEKDVPESMTEDVLISENGRQSFHELTSTKCNSFELCDQESGMDRNPHVTLSDTFGSEGCASETTHDLNIKFESIGEISGVDVKEKKVFEIGQCLNDIVGDKTGTALLESESEFLNSGVQRLSSTDYLEEDCDACTSEISTPFALDKENQSAGGNTGTCLLENELLTSGDQHLSSTDNHQDVNKEDCYASECEISNSLSLEIGNKTPAMDETPVSSSAHKKLVEERNILTKKTKEIDRSSYNDKNPISKKQTKFQTLVQRDPLHLPFKPQSRVGNDQVGNVQAHSTKVIKFSCNICCKSFRKKCHLRLHMRTHIRDKEFHTNIGIKSFYGKGHLARHMRTHPGVKRFYCPICKKTNGNEFCMQTHVDLKLFECKICKKSFSRKGSLHRHMRTHSGKRPFECEICKKSFSEKESLNRHMRTHSGDRQYECEMCEKLFLRKAHLNGHMGTHTGDRPFKCEICKKSFLQKAHLNGHMRTHSGDRPFKCDICKKSFSEKGNLDRHMRTHTGDRPFMCEICKKSYLQKAHLNEHMRTHSGDRPFQCDICKKSFCRKQHLNRHMQMHPCH